MATARLTASATRASATATSRIQPSANRDNALYYPASLLCCALVYCTDKEVQSFTCLGALGLKSRTCPLKSPDGPAHAGCASGGTYGSSTTNRKPRSPSRPEWLRQRNLRPFCMDAVCGPFARNTTPNFAPYTTESCFVSSGHSARDQTIE